MKDLLDVHLQARIQALQEASVLAARLYPSLDTRALAVDLLRLARESYPDDREIDVDWDGALALRVDEWARTP